MKAISLLLLIIASGVESLECPDGQLECGSAGCYDPTTQGCIGNSWIIQCSNPCYVESSPDPICYNPSTHGCFDNEVCERHLACGGHCVNDPYTACAHNQTRCPGFFAWGYYTYFSDKLDVCGPQQQCYDNRQSVCLGGTTVCPGLNAQLCGTECYNPDIQACVNDIVQCLNPCHVESSPDPICYNPSTHGCFDNEVCERHLACGGHCVNDPYTACAHNQTRCPGFFAWGYYTYFSDKLDVCGPQQQCYDNRQSVCLGGTTVCPGLNAQLCGTECYNPDIQACVNDIVQCLNPCHVESSPDPICYNPSTHGCFDNEVCERHLACGGHCINDPYTACAHNQTRCPGFFAWGYYTYFSDKLDVCGPQQQCYDNRQSVCFDGTTVCSVGSQLCSGACYDPRFQYCVGGNNTIFCLANPSAPNCPSATTIVPSTTTTIPVTTTTVPSTTTAIPLTTTTVPLTTTTVPWTTTTIPSTTTTIPLTTTTVPLTTTTVPSTTTTIISTSQLLSTTIPMTNVSDCCGPQECNTNADCCQAGSLECQCYRHTTTDVYGTCLNPYTSPICADGCPIEGKCRSDSDCCKCQCAQVTFTDVDGNSSTKKQCIRR